MKDNPAMHENACCGRRWVGTDRAHCCARAGFPGCGEVFDDSELWDAHRREDGSCRTPGSLRLVPTKNGIWQRGAEQARFAS